MTGVETAMRVGTPGAGWLLALASRLAPIVVLVSLWLPEIWHVRAPRAVIDDAVVDSARSAPEDSVLDELRTLSLLPIADRDSTLEMAVAEGILRGRLELPEMTPSPIGVSFDARDLVRLPAELRLWYAGFVVPDFLLAAYVRSGRDEFFLAARDFITGWGAFEQSAWLPQGLLWNDHATAARVRVLAEFWRIYRTRPEFTLEGGRAVLQQAARYGHFLSSPEHFTFSTNHGVMQNLGLLQLSLAFPALPQAPEYLALARSRLDRQIGFLIGADGVIRENSAGYQAFGLELLAMTFRCLTLLGESVPEEWATRYRAGLRFLQVMRRPDGTLPLIGDTEASNLGTYPRVTDVDAEGRSSVLRPFVADTPTPGSVLHSAPGYWVHWAASASESPTTAQAQTVVWWGFPPGPGHKHADEMSVHVWSEGIPWLTAIGYWPYTEEGRGEAEGWRGSNAPHARGEDLHSPRSTRLLSHGSSGRLALLDAERIGPGAFRARRQVVQVGDDAWVILDSVSGAPGGSETVWTFPSGLVLEQTAEWSYALRERGGTASAQVDLVGGPGTTSTVLEGSRDPLIGWNVVRMKPRPAPSVSVEQPGPASHLVAVVRRVKGGMPALPAPTLREGEAADSWVVDLPLLAGHVELRRLRGYLVVTRKRGAVSLGADTVVLREAPDVRVELQAVSEAFESMSKEYPRFRSSLARREKLSVVLLLLFLGQELVFLGVKRRWTRARTPLKALSLVCWFGLGVWLHSCFMPSWETVTPLMGATRPKFRRAEGKRPRS